RDGRQPKIAQVIRQCRNDWEAYDQKELERKKLVRRKLFAHASSDDLAFERFPVIVNFEGRNDGNHIAREERARVLDDRVARFAVLVFFTQEFFRRACFFLMEESPCHQVNTCKNKPIGYQERYRVHTMDLLYGIFRKMKNLRIVRLIKEAAKII